MNSQLDNLKAEADALGIKYQPSIGEEKLMEKIEAAVAAAKKDKEKKPKRDAGDLPLGVELTQVQINIAKAKSLVKVKISNLDPMNTGGNTVTSGVFNQHMSLQRVIPLNREYAVEEALVQEIEKRTFITSVPEQDHNGDYTGNFKAVEAPVYAVIRYPKA